MIELFSESKNHNHKKNDGVLGKYLKECETYRKSSIYNYEYKYIKEIIWDDDKNIQYGDSRGGYEKFKLLNENAFIGYGGFVSLREINDINTKEIIGYITETKLTNNKNQDEMNSILNNAKQEVIEILDVNSSAFCFWLEEYTEFGNNGYVKDADEVISRIKYLERILEDYNSIEDFKNFIDRLKEGKMKP